MTELTIDNDECLLTCDQGRQRPLVTEQDKELEMTGRERRKYNEWKTERQKIDDDRIARHRKSTWSRDWDSNKTEQV